MSLNESTVEATALTGPEAAHARLFPLGGEKPEPTLRDPAVAGRPKLLSGELRVAGTVSAT